MKGAKPGSRLYLANYIGLGKSKEGKDRKLLEALGYIMYDYVGLLVETAIRKRTGGRLEALPKGAVICGDVVLNIRSLSLLFSPHVGEAREDWLITRERVHLI